MVGARELKEIRQSRAWDFGEPTQAGWRG